MGGRLPFGVGEYHEHHHHHLHHHLRLHHPPPLPDDHEGDRRHAPGRARKPRAGRVSMSTPLQIALEVIAPDWNPVPLSRQTKKPIGKDWQKRIITAKTAARYFNGAAINVGVQLGPHSHGLTDVDLDCPEAVAVASLMLPNTDATFG